jgi:hypothetical protein
MNDALPLFALAAAISSVALVVRTAGRLWLRARELEANASMSISADAAAHITAFLAQIDARLARLEESVDVTGIEVERLAEAQRFAARLQAGSVGASAEPAATPATRAPARKGEDFS